MKKKRLSTMTYEVPSLELCQALKDAGWEQDDHCWYYNTDDPRMDDMPERYVWKKGFDYLVAAPTVCEMVEWLYEFYNEEFDINCLVEGESHFYYCSIDAIDMHWKSDTLPNAVAQAILWVLKEEK